MWEGLGCVGFVYKIVEITAASSNNGGGEWLGSYICMGGMEWVQIFPYTLIFFPCRIFLSVDRSHLS